MYRTIIGIYHLLCCLTFQERQRRANVFPLTLSPHGSNLAEVLAAFKQLTELDAGVEVIVNGTPTEMLVFVLAYIGDMPQQAWNAGFMGPRARRGCRTCYIDANEDGRGKSLCPC